MSATFHVIGAGLAGLAAALSLVQAGRRVVIHEAGPAAGGRCRSYFDRGLGMRLDNGNHLILSGNRATTAFLDQIGARHSLGGPGVAAFPFMDLATDERWTVAPGEGRAPWWLLDQQRRVAGTKARDYLALVPLLRAAGDATVASVLRDNTLYRRLLEPLAIAALNTQPERGLAVLLARVMKETLLRGGVACVPSFPRIGLSESFIDPALDWLRERGATLHLGRRVAALRRDATRVTGIETSEGMTDVAPGDGVVLAVPAWVAADLLPGLRTPDEHETILNVHFRLDPPTPPPFARAGFIGLIGGTAEWVFVKAGALSVTISAAAGVADDSAERIAATVWPEVRRAAALDGATAMPPMRVVKERRATFAATAAQERRRPGARIGLANLALAGDWTATGLPATIEGRDPFRPYRGGYAARLTGIRPGGIALRRHLSDKADLCCIKQGMIEVIVPGDFAMLADVALATDWLDRTVERARDALLRRQRPDGHWVFELEADATIPAEYVLLEHFQDRIDPELEGRIGVYLRRNQAAHGGWPLFFDGAFNLSASVKAYFALKAIGDDIEAPHMRRARAAILAAGGAERSNVFTRAQLALFGEVPWRAVPAMPLQIMLLPRWFPFHLDRISYWSRTVLVPLLVLMAAQPRARNPRGVHVTELFVTPPAQVRDWVRGPYRSGWGYFFKHLDRLVRPMAGLAPARQTIRARDAAVEFVIERLNGEDGLGAIYPAMANSVMMFDVLGYPADHPHAATAWQAVRKLLVVEADEAYCQPCLSPVWDTALAGHAMAEAVGGTGASVTAANAWLRERQVLDVVGDWARTRPGVAPGGWAFQYANPHYPDVDDTAVAGMLLHRESEGGPPDPAQDEAIERARAWVVGMQGGDGGWGAFDADNNHHYLNHIPFADHGALLDPSTADVTARCVSFLGQAGMAATDPAMRQALDWLREAQEPDGSWFGRWGTNYLYGTWSVLCALNAAGVAGSDPAVRGGVGFLLATQREDGGWGEDNESYAASAPGRYDRSNPSQTAWALLGLMAAGEVDHPAVARGIAWLAATQSADGEWEEKPFTAVGFPRVFYLRYHGYRLIFPLLAVARYRNLTRGNDRSVGWGF